MPSRARPLAHKTFTSVSKVKNPPFRPFPRLPHLSAALVAFSRHTPDPDSPAYRVTRRAKTCAVTHAPNSQSFLLERRTSNSALSSERCTCARISQLDFDALLIQTVTRIEFRGVQKHARQLARTISISPSQIKSTSPQPFSRPPHVLADLAVCTQRFRDFGHRSY